MKLIAEHAFPARPGQSAGAVLLRENVPGDRMRYVTHWRNDEFKGTGNGRYLATLAEGMANFEARVAEEIAARVAVDPGLAPRGPFTVSLWGSPREEGNDDHHTGDDYATYDEAIVGFARLTTSPRHAYWRHAYLDGADGPIRRMVNPAPPAPSDDDDLDRSEAANMAGMAHGTSGRNEALGEEVEEAPAFGMR